MKICFFGLKALQSYDLKKEDEKIVGNKNGMCEKNANFAGHKNTNIMTISTEELFRISSGLSDKDVENQRLRDENAQLSKKCELLVQRVLQMEQMQGCEQARQMGFVQLSLEKIRGLLSKVQDLNLISTFVMFLMKALPDGACAEDVKKLSDLMHVPQQPHLTLTNQFNAPVGIVAPGGAINTMQQ